MGLSELSEAFFDIEGPMAARWKFSIQHNQGWPTANQGWTIWPGNRTTPSQSTGNIFGGFRGSIFNHA
jgi:hypothetical protein